MVVYAAYEKRPRSRLQAFSMTRIRPIPLHSKLALFEAASAKVEAQRIKLAGIKEDDPQRSREESLLRSMINNASAARLLVCIGQDR